MTNPYATGNRVYNSGTSAPTVGTVDPSGYIEREMSQTRSGLAAAAMRRLNGGEVGPAVGGIQQTPQPTIYNGLHYFPTGQMYPAGHPAGPDTDLRRPPNRADPSLPPSTPPSGIPELPAIRNIPAGDIPAAPPAPPAPAVTTQPTLIWVKNPDGTVTQYNAPPGFAVNAGNSQTNPYNFDYSKVLPWDPATAPQYNTLGTQRVDALSGAKIGLDQLLANITTNRDTFQHGVPKAYENLLDAMSERGMLHSSVYGEQYGDLADKVARALAGFDTQTKNANVNYGLRTQGINDRYDSGVAGLLGQAASDLASSDQGNLLGQLLSALGLTPYTAPTPTAPAAPATTPTKAPVNGWVWNPAPGAPGGGYWGPPRKTHI